MTPPHDADGAAQRIVQEEQPSVLFDTNVVLDVLLKRQPWLADASTLFGLNDERILDGALAGHAVTTVYYLYQRGRAPALVRKHLLELLASFSVAPVGYSELHRAAVSDFTDFEDGVAHEAAVAFGCHGLVTRNEADFAAARLPITTPAALVRAFASH